MNPLSDAKILQSWAHNVQPWTQAVRRGEIASRKRVTDQAVVDAMCSRAPRTVLDLGCGEGWLARRLAADGMTVHGVDAIAELVDAARAGGGGSFQTLSYEAIAAGALQDRYDAVVCNFALLGEQAVTDVLAVVPQLLQPHGSLIVQTLHPLIACGDAPYVDGWRAGSWAGFSADFCDPAPWYFRTLHSWLALFARSGLRLVELREPLHPDNGKPASVIFIAEATHEA